MVNLLRGAAFTARDDGRPTLFGFDEAILCGWEGGGKGVAVLQLKVEAHKVQSAGTAGIVSETIAVWHLLVVE